MQESIITVLKNRVVFLKLTYNKGKYPNSIIAALRKKIICDYSRK